MVAITVQYRLEKTHGTTPLEAVQDAKSAIRWVRTKVGELSIDPEMLAAGGGSAGGHLALMTALTPKLAEPDEDQTIPSQPDALVLFNPVLDNGPEGFAQHRMPENWREIHRTQEGA